MATLAQNQATLWQAALSYEQSQLSGAMFALLALGMVSRTPKCLATVTWCGVLWGLYYTRFQQVTAGTIDPALLDFTSVGLIPYPVPELWAEVNR